MTLCRLSAIEEPSRNRVTGGFCHTKSLLQRKPRSRPLRWVGLQRVDPVHELLDRLTDDLIGVPG